MTQALLGVLAVTALALLVVMLFILSLLLKRGGQDVQTAVLAEKLSKLEPVSQAVSSIQVGLGELQAYTRARQDLETQTAQSIKRLEAVIAGTQAKGAAGENILETVFSKLPPEWQVRDFRVGNKSVEFGLRLPGDAVLPIDSKWTATNLLEQFVLSRDVEEQRRLKMAIETAVLDKAKEVRKYLDPNLTTSFGVAAVPDAVYDLCSGIQCDVFRLNVVLISYSMFIPYLLLVFQTMLRSSRSVDLRKLDGYVQSIRDGIDALQEELEGRFARALTMLGNSRSDMAVHLSKVSSGITSLQISAAPASPEGEPGNIVSSPASDSMER